MIHISRHPIFGQVPTNQDISLSYDFISIPSTLEIKLSGKLTFTSTYSRELIFLCAGVYPKSGEIPNDQIRDERNLSPYFIIPFPFIHTHDVRLILANPPERTRLAYNLEPDFYAFLTALCKGDVDMDDIHGNRSEIYKRLLCDYISDECDREGNPVINVFPWQEWHYTDT